MSLILRVRSYKALPPSTPLLHCFDQAGGSIGRTSDNQLMLPDADKLVSRKHAYIEYQKGQYYWVDTGSNPSAINGQPISSGQRALLSNGALISLGDYLLEVAYEAEIDNPFEAYSSAPQLPELNLLAAEPALNGPALLDNPLGIDLFDTAAHAASVTLPAAESDHISPELQAIPRAGVFASLAIPADYDPLHDLMASATPQTPSLAASASITQIEAPTAMATQAAESCVSQALLRGLGLTERDVHLPAEELAELVGVLLRTLISGTMGTLSARTILKRETRIDLTMMASQANNPLKFMPDAQSALKQLLSNALPGYMPAVKAVNAACDDLRHHEIAVMAGMRAALMGVLQRFDPAEIERQIKAGTLVDNVFGANRKARLWDRLTEVHTETQSGLEDDFQTLFGEHFASAYEEQIEKMRRTAPRRS